ncbi:hypothetical protein PG991_001515 [Apiospora marii]|uniref:Uncharacterized protein n=1 Tax=Apiospora marii TaxID=335849 RepID=A0ABR1SS81_9PEZI
MSVLLEAMAVALVLLLHCVWRKLREASTYKVERDERPPNAHRVLPQGEDDGDVQSALIRLFNDDGAGQWPPKVSHNLKDWPPLLRPYQDIYASMSPLFATAEPSMDDAWNTKRRADFRGRMQALLANRIDMLGVEATLQAAAAGDIVVATIIFRVRQATDVITGMKRQLQDKAA